MSRDISSSDSEDDREISQNSEEQHKKVSKYKCPADFVSFEYNSSASALLDSDEQHKELWLIKAPTRFDPRTLSDLKVPLSGLKMIQATGATSQRYSVLGSRAAQTDVHLLTSSKRRKGSLSASSFTGILSISESYGDCTENQSLLSIPTAPAPSVPPGLRQRFQPFGSSRPTCAAGAAASASSSPLRRAKLDTEGCDEHRKKKKKKKTEKLCKEENVEVLNIKQEQMSYDYGEIQFPEATEDVDRRKKKKKEKHTEDCPDEVAVNASFIAKHEPIDTSYGDIDSTVKKKKKKKKKKKTLDE